MEGQEHLNRFRPTPDYEDGVVQWEKVVEVMYGVVMRVGQCGVIVFWTRDLSLLFGVGIIWLRHGCWSRH